MSLAGNSGLLTRVRHSSRKSSATYSYSVVCAVFSLSKQWYGCQCLGSLTCAQILIDARDCTRRLYRTDTVKESALPEADSRRKKSLPHLRLEPSSVSRLAFFSQVYQVSGYFPFFFYLSVSPDRGRQATVGLFNS